MHILRELFHGNIRGFDSRQYSKDSPFFEAVKRRQEHKDRLLTLISDEAKQELEAYEDAASDVHSITTYDCFEYTLTFAIRLMAAVLPCEGGGCRDDTGGD